MLNVLLVILILLVVFNHFDSPFTSSTTYYIKGKPITLINILVTILIIWLLFQIAGPLTPLFGIVLVIWLLSIIGGFAIGGLSDILILAIILYLLFQIF